MNEDGLLFARELAKAKHRYFDDKLALSEFLQRRNLGQGHTMAERRAALRMSREQSSLTLDVKQAAHVSELPTAQRSLGALTAVETEPDDPGFRDPDDLDELDDDPPTGDGHFYEDLWRTYEHDPVAPRKKPANLDNLTFSRKEGWRDYVERPSGSGPRAFEEPIRRLSDASADIYNQRRGDWHNNIGPLKTPQLTALA